MDRPGRPETAPNGSGEAKKRLKAPRNCYWRNGILWGRFKVKGIQYRLSLRTSVIATAKRRIEEERDRKVLEVRFGDRRKSYEAAFIEWSGHVATQVSETTATRYAVSLAQLEPILRPLYIDEIDKGTIAEIIRTRRESGTSMATIRRDLSALSNFLGYCEDEGLRDDNPALGRMRKLKERRDPIVLPDPAHVDMVVTRAPGRFSDLIAAARHTGCRQQELSKSKRRHFDRGRRQLTVVGKRNRLRVIDLNASAFNVFGSQTLSLASELVLLHDDGEPYKNVSSRFRALVKDVAAKAAESSQKGTQSFRPFRFHDLRHLFAVEWLKRGGSIYDLQQHLGHESVKTTEIYLKYLTAEEARVAKSGVAQTGTQTQRFGEGQSE